jgi:hypothetical protein
MKVSVTVRCVRCGGMCEIEQGEIAPDDVPMCHACYMPMVAVKATARKNRRSRDV